MIVKSWSMLVLASAFFVTLGYGVIRFVMRLLRSNREQILATAAVLPDQELTIREPGEIVLLLEVPRLGSDYRNFEFEVVENATGQTAKMKYDYLRAQGAVYGVTTMRVPLGCLTAHQAGTFRLRISGLQTGKDYTRSRGPTWEEWWLRFLALSFVESACS